MSRFSKPFEINEFYKKEQNDDEDREEVRKDLMKEVIVSNVQDLNPSSHRMRVMLGSLTKLTGTTDT